MSVALTQMAPPRIQVDRGEGFVTRTIWPAGLRHVRGAILIVLCLYACFMFLTIYYAVQSLEQSRNPGEIWIIGLIFMTALTTLTVLGTGYQASAGKSSITVGPSDVIIRFSGFFGSSSVHWLRDEITDISARVQHSAYEVGPRFMFVGALRRMYVLSFMTVPNFRMRLLDTLFLNRDEATWLADALRRELELPKRDVER